MALDTNGLLDSIRLRVRCLKVMTVYKSTLSDNKKEFINRYSKLSEAIMFLLFSYFQDWLFPTKGFFSYFPDSMTFLMEHCSHGYTSGRSTVLLAGVILSHVALYYIVYEM